MCWIIKGIVPTHYGIRSSLKNKSLYVIMMLILNKSGLSENNNNTIYNNYYNEKYHKSYYNLIKLLQSIQFGTIIPLIFSQLTEHFKPLRQR